MDKSTFQLHPQLQKDCQVLGCFTLCRLLLHNDANYPWFILVPGRDDISEIYQLTQRDQRQLMHESSLLSRTLAVAFEAHKLNVAALGNVVPQLHVHHIVRYRNDAAWPAPIWGAAPARAYDAETRKIVIARFMQAMDSNEFESINREVR